MVFQGIVYRGGLKERRAREYYNILLKLNVQTMGQMDSPELVAAILVKAASNLHCLRTLVTAYNYYRNANHIEKT